MFYMEITWMQFYIVTSLCWTHKTDLLSGLWLLLISLIPQKLVCP